MIFHWLCDETVWRCLNLTMPVGVLHREVGPQPGWQVLSKSYLEQMTQVYDSLGLIIPEAPHH